jgi:hypothetical protein
MNSSPGISTTSRIPNSVAGKNSGTRTEEIDNQKPT